MINQGKKKGTVRFEFKPANKVKTVALAGNFTQWKPVTMRKQKDGAFTCIVPLDLGTYEYKFVVDGQWIKDPDNHNVVTNEFGTPNSVVKVH